MDTAAQIKMASSTSWRSHFVGTLTLGLPLVGAQLAQYLIHTTDVLIVGQLGTVELAAIVLSAQYFFTLFIFGSGFSAASIPLAAQAEGRGDKTTVRRAIRMGMWVSLLYAVLVMPLFIYSEPILLFLGQKPDVASLATEYLHIIGIGMFPALMVMCLRSFLSALERAREILLTTIAMLIFNAIFAYIFVLGRFGAPSLGLAGAAMVAIAAQCFALIIMVIYTNRKLSAYELFVRFWRPDWEAFFDVIRLGLPISISILAEVSLFTVASLMMGWIGTNELAAHGIALQYASMAFMIPLGLSQAATVRVGIAAGRGEYEAVRRAAIAALVLAAAVALLGAMLYLFQHNNLASLYVDNTDPDAAAVIAIAGPFIVIAGIFQLFDGLQAIGAGLARGLKDSTVPMILALISYWAIGFPAAYILAFPLEVGGNGIWFGFLGGLFAAAILMNLRFFAQLKKASR
ncbi:MATE family efflux transporter [Rhizobium sp. L1K21]|uniref:MATE family efflux transporter n=1 Tax=Rhizobium sp. L1K21 TaxID=2954933 RepID=UPI002092200A|nr:MATE family efflux transporter [Rhizobium sp. L1K21]MCO6185522.1 MATE family efflux transporter [Rhizobium sp. L1K21]